MVKIRGLCLFFVIAVLLSGCDSKEGQLKIIRVQSPPGMNKTLPFMNKEQAQDGYFLSAPEFLKDISGEMSPILKDYLNFNEDEFSEKYSTEKLWEEGVFDRLFFTDKFEGPIISDISVGDSKEKIFLHLGSPQFTTEKYYSSVLDDYRSFYLIGYKTKEYYFAFQIEENENLEQVVKSICFKKRSVLPKDKIDIMMFLAEEESWQTKFKKNMKQWNSKFQDDSQFYFVNWKQGGATLISEYGFISTSANYDSYRVFADYEGEIPVLPLRCDDQFNRFYDPITILNVDYPEQLIYNVYSYFAQVRSAISNQIGVFSADGSLFAYAQNNGNLLDFTQMLGKEDDAHIVIRWMDSTLPDRQIFFGNFADVIGFIDARYVIEKDITGLHVYDLQENKIVYADEDPMIHQSSLHIDYVNCRILDEKNKVRYVFAFDRSGLLIVSKI